MSVQTMSGHQSRARLQVAFARPHFDELLPALDFVSARLQLMSNS